MGGSQSVEIPGGGSEGYHVLKVCWLMIATPYGVCVCVLCRYWITHQEIRLSLRHILTSS